jgi:hypothetical protein
MAYSQKSPLTTGILSHLNHLNGVVYSKKHGGWGGGGYPPLTAVQHDAKVLDKTQSFSRPTRPQTPQEAKPIVRSATHLP